MQPNTNDQKFWELCIPEQELIEKIKKQGYSALLQQISDQIRDHFPFMKYWIPEETLDTMFQNVKNYRAEWVEQRYRVNTLTIPSAKLQYRGKPLLLKNEHGDYLKYNLLVEWFAEHIRLLARRFNQTENILTFYKNHTTAIVRHCIENYKQITAKDIRESVYRSHYECTEFRVTHICAFIDLWRPKNILDFSSGRGARLIGALSREDQIDRYVGVDPDPNLHPIYEQIITRFAKNPSKFCMIQAPFESDEIKITPDYDLVFTSTPYFNLEIYNEEDPNQSITKFPTLKEWLDGFMYPSLTKSWHALRKGGRLALVLNDPVESAYPEEAPKYTEQVVRFCHRLAKQSSGQYEGVISYAGFEKNKPRSPQPVWIWQKG